MSLSLYALVQQLPPLPLVPGAPVLMGNLPKTTELASLCRPVQDATTESQPLRLGEGRMGSLVGSN